ncbi:MAG: farnesyl diphosphate synthase [Perlucidibaca sp.]
MFSEFLARQNPLDQRLTAAIAYAMQNGGKRVRPALVWGGCLAAGGSWGDADSAAIAIECIHGYSLVHDDLPCMDDDDLRRGQPTCHRQFDEATALLAGDALQVLAFRSIAGSARSAPVRAAQGARLAEAAFDMVVGQRLDLAAEGCRLDLEPLETVHRHKTGALIRAAVTLGALAGGADQAMLDALDRYADRLGLAFQVHDDVLDVIGDTAVLGKQAGADIALDKSTYPALLGLEAAQKLARELNEQALAALAHLGSEADPLRELARFLMSRDH